MRQIKFRAKSVEDGGSGWIYGDLFNAASGITIIENGGRSLRDFHFVDHETVGQFTGLYDKDGKEIYEGDIIKVWIELPKESEECVVLWDESEFVVCFNDEEQELLSEWNTDQHSKKIIGNIFDNPELRDS